MFIGNVTDFVPEFRELRLMVYERVLLNRTKRVDLTRAPEIFQAPSILTVISTSVPSTSMLATCRLVYQEAQPVLQAAMQRFLGKDMLLADRLEGPAPRIEVDFDAISILQYRHGLVGKILMQYEELLSDPNALPRDHDDRQILGRLYTLENGNKSETIQALQDFIEVAAKALLYQKTCIDNARKSRSASGPFLYPEIQIAVRLCDNSESSSRFEVLSSLASGVESLRGHDKVQTRIHVMDPPWLQSPVTGMSIFTILSEAARASSISALLFPLPFSTPADPRQRIIAGECEFEETKKGIYDRLWRDGEW